LQGSGYDLFLDATIISWIVLPTTHAEKSSAKEIAASFFVMTWSAKAALEPIERTGSKGALWDSSVL